MELQTRIVVLEIALKIEKGINELVVMFLNIDLQKRKALTNSSGGLSFKNKIDLLFDIEIIDKVEYENLLLVMEYRNQFMHNYDCNTFSDANKLLGSDKEKKLLKFSSDVKENLDEEDWKVAYLILFDSTLQIILAKIDMQKLIMDENKLYLDVLVSNVVTLTDAITNLWDIVTNATKIHENMSSEMIEFLKKITQELKLKFADKEGIIEIEEEALKRITFRFQRANR